MRKVPVRVVLVALALLVAAQFVPVTRSNPPVQAEAVAPPHVKAVLQRACYDCHSNETVWPWYARVAPASWLVARDVREGREELNFSAWNRIPAEQQAKKLRDAWKEVADGEMPPRIYVALHREASLSAQDRKVLREWADGVPPAAETKVD